METTVYNQKGKESGKRSLGRSSEGDGYCTGGTNSDGVASRIRDLVGPIPRNTCTPTAYWSVAHVGKGNDGCCRGESKVLAEIHGGSTECLSIIRIVLDGACRNEIPLGLSSR